MKSQQTWVVSQLGAREHYGVARALASQGALGALVTEAWAPPGSIWSRIAPRLAQRFHFDLAQLPVHAWTGQSVIFEALARGRGLAGWDLMLARNHWYGRNAVAALERLALEMDRLGNSSNAKPTLFSYSYTALELFRWAKTRGWRTVLGQIDPGEHKKIIVKELQSRCGGINSRWVAAPVTYWEEWRKECELADKIIVNSEWSRIGLLKKNIDARKIINIPLIFENKTEKKIYARKIPQSFSAIRPLRLLFLGQITVRKGIFELFDAINLLKSENVVFDLVGPSTVEMPVDIKSNPKVKWLGAVTREDVFGCYRSSDILIFPTHSDGFGLTQLEAMSQGLPVIASRNCGDVIQEGVNGLLLDKVSGQEIANKIMYFLKNPSALESMMQNCHVNSRFSMSHVGKLFVAA